MRTGQWKTMGIGSLIGKMIYAVFGLAASMLCIMGYYPVGAGILHGMLSG